jgi:hypothetical protein
MNPSQSDNTMPRINVFYILETNLTMRRNREGVTAAYGVKHGTFQAPALSTSSAKQRSSALPTRPCMAPVGIGHLTALTNYAIRINEY